MAAVSSSRVTAPDVPVRDVSVRGNNAVEPAEEGQGDVSVAIDSREKFDGPSEAGGERGVQKETMVYQGSVRSGQQVGERVWFFSLPCPGCIYVYFVYMLFACILIAVGLLVCNFFVQL